MNQHFFLRHKGFVDTAQKGWWTTTRSWVLLAAPSLQLTANAPENRQSQKHMNQFLSIIVSVVTWDQVFFWRHWFGARFGIFELGYPNSNPNPFRFSGIQSESKPPNAPNHQLTFTRWWFQIFVICYFHPYLGKWSNLTNIFQMGWNPQLV